MFTYIVSLLLAIPGVRNSSVKSASDGCLLFNQDICFVMFQDAVSISVLSEIS